VNGINPIPFENWILLAIITTYVILFLFAILRIANCIKRLNIIRERVYNELMSPNGLFLMVIFTIICTVCFFLYIYNNANEPEKWVIVFTAGAAIAGFLFNSAVKLHSETRDKTFNLLITTGNTDFREKSDFYWQFRRTFPHEKLTAEDIQCILAEGNYKSKNTVKRTSSRFRNSTYSGKKKIVELKNSMFYTANFFEEIAIAIRQRDISEPTLREFYNSMFGQFWGFFEPFLKVVRNKNEEFKFVGLDYNVGERPEAFKNLEWLANRWVEKV
jgi:uncharacterized membrane protein